MDGFKQSLVAQVDPKFGDNATAELENPNLKFRTISAAFQAIKDSGIPGLWTIQLFGNEHIDLPEIDQDVVICGNQATTIKRPIVCKNGATVHLHNITMDTGDETPINTTEGSVILDSSTVTSSASQYLCGSGTCRNTTFNWTPQAGNTTFINSVPCFFNMDEGYILSGNTYNIDLSNLNASSAVTVYNVVAGSDQIGSGFCDTNSTINILTGPQISQFTFLSMGGGFSGASLNSITTCLENLMQPNSFLIVNGQAGGFEIGANVTLNKVNFNNVPFNLPSSPYMLNNTCLTITNSTWNGEQLPPPPSNLDPSSSFSQNYVTGGCTIVTTGGLHVSTRTVNAVQDGPVSLVQYDDYSLFVDTSQGSVKLIIPPFTGDIEGKFLLFRNITPKCGPFKVEVQEGKINKKFAGFKVPKVLELQHSRGVWWRI